MMKKAFQIVEFARYLLNSRHWRGHGVHSPFMYDFVRNVLMKASHKPNARKYKAKLKQLTPKSIEQSSFGASPGSGTVSTAQLVGRISISPKYGKLLNTIVASYQPKQVLELGSGLGVSTYYLANNNPQSQVVTVEGMKPFAEIAQATLNSLAINNVSIINRTFDEFFDGLTASQKFDLVFIDGAHSYESTTKSFERSIGITTPEAFIILDDIRWSEDMFRAWNELKMHPKVRVSADLGRIGLLFLNPILQKQDYIVRY